MKTQKFKTFIFDLDGTLLNTLNDLAASTNHALLTNGMAERSIDEVRQFVGNGVRLLIERAVEPGTDKATIDRVFADFKTHYMHHSLDTTRPYDGVMDMLHELRHRGIRIAVVSNKLYAATRELCHHFFADTVEVAIGEKEGIRRKPSPDTVIEAMLELGVDKTDAVYVGDSDVDIATAKNCGIPCISVLWGFRDKDFLIEHGAQTFVNHPSELLEFC
ncbi:MAG: HAD-IIIA family hydrolase [Prevotellaceae bacterium]|nr:HAD-IIIA family hydrolase [Prevotellaceae bacterium]MDY6199059.1 HAD-IIIA family hydrolase [Prevotella sp.]